MKLVDRHLAWRCCRFYALATLALIAASQLMEAVDLVGRISDGEPAGEAIGAMLRQLPPLYVTISPLAALLAAVVCLALADRQRETLAMELSGVNPLRLWLPLLCCGLLFSGAPFLTAEFSGSAMHRRRSSEPIRAPALALPDTFIYASRFNPADNRFTDLNIIFFQPGGTLKEVHQAREGEIGPAGDWQLEDGISVRFDARGAPRAREDFRFRRLSGDRPATTLVPLLKPLETLSARELRLYLRLLAEAGLAPAAVRTAYYTRFSYPALNLVVIFLALPVIAASRHARPLRVAGAILLGMVLYWVFSLALALGRQGALPAPAAAFAAHLLTGALALPVLCRPGRASRLTRPRP